MKNALLNYDAKDWRRLHDNASAMAKNIPNITWSDPLMRIAQAAMEMEGNICRCTIESQEAKDATTEPCPHCGHEGCHTPYGMAPQTNECNKCGGTWNNDPTP